MEESDAWESLPAQKSSIVILTIGASGTGKSALINGLVGAEVAKEDGETLCSQTCQLSCYKAKKKNTDIEIWDTPGMEVANESAKLEQLVTDIQEKVCEVDLILFCTNMTSARFRQGDHQNVKIITKAFGDSIWKNAVFVLTFANQVKLPPTKKNTPLNKYFDERLTEWKHEIEAALLKIGVSKMLAESVKIVPAGYYDERSLPGRNNWLSDFWHTCLEGTREGAQATLLHVNIDRLKAETEVCLVKPNPPLKDQPIISTLHNNANVFAVGGFACVAVAAAATGLGGAPAVVGGGLLGVGVVCGLAYLAGRKR